MTMKLALDVMMALAILSTLLILTLLVVLRGIRERSLGRCARYVCALVVIVSLLIISVACEEGTYSGPQGGPPPPPPTMCARPLTPPTNPITGQPEPNATWCTSP